MLPGQLGLLLIGIISALALGVLGVFSYLAFSKEKQQKAREARARRREQWHESLKATADDDLLGAFAEQDAAQEPAEEAELFPEETLEPPDPVTPFGNVDQAPLAEESTIVMKPVSAPKPAPAPKPKNTRNDFDFKF